jgi:hypothetical protein
LLNKKFSLWKGLWKFLQKKETVNYKCLCLA